ncbi:hypothetical protein RP20_CCG019937 [Aedes albopictus]|nr:hypothetical protein RP20_CCG019937 [Aedes albopictus]
MSWFQARNFFDSFRPVYVATKACHIHFETLDFQQQTIRRTLLDQFRFIFTMVVDAYFIYRSIVLNLPYLYLTESVLLNVGNYLSLVLLSMLTFTLPLWNRLKTEEVFEIYANVNECDRKLGTLGIEINYRRHYWISVVYVLCTMCAAIIGTWNAVSVRRDSAWTNITMTAPQVLTVVAIFRISTNYGLFTCYSNLSLISINERLDSLYSVMTKHLATMITSPSTVSSGQVCHMIRQVAETHHQLNDTILLFNRCYSFQVLHATTMSAFFTLFVVFGFIHAYASEKNDITMNVTWNNLLYDVFYIAMFLQLVVSTSFVSGNCKRIATAVHKMISHAHYDKGIFRELESFSQQLNHHASRISSGLCDFDWTLLYSVRFGIRCLWCHRIT